jgi:hypothetical protein
MARRTTQDTLNLLIKAVSQCVAESQDKVSQSLLSVLKALTTNISPDPEERERDRRTMRGLVLLIKERLEGVNAVGTTLCGCLAETILLLTFKDTTPFKNVVVKVPAGEGGKPTDRCPIKVGDAEIIVPRWALQAFYLRLQGVKYSEISKQFNVSRQLAQYWVNRLKALNPTISEEPKVSEAPPPEKQSPSSLPDETIWHLLKGKVKG